MDVGGIILGDFLWIHNGSNEQSSQIEKLSGNLGSFGISSTGNSLFVKFESDEYVNDKGFFATIHYGNPYLYIKMFSLCCIRKAKFDCDTVFQLIVLQ